jgi:bacillithiol biosynthesis deacetylase BshB1
MTKKKDLKLDVLAFGAHPDDVEAGCGGMLAYMANSGKRTGIVDLSQAELSTNGTLKQREREASNAAKILGVEVRENLKLPNNFFFNSKEVQRKIINVIRKYKPEMVLLPYWFDRHPDHESVRSLVWPALFTGGLLKYKTNYQKHRPGTVLFYRLWYDFTPSFIFDVSDVFDKKIEAIKAYESQFAKTNVSIETKDNDQKFFDFWNARHLNDGYHIGVKYGEPYLSTTPLGVTNLDSFLPNYS